MTNFRPTTLSPEALKAWDEAEANIQASMQRIKELTAPLRHPTPQPPITPERVLAQRCEILAAFVSKYGFDPDRAMQIEQRQADGTTTWRIERRPQPEPENRSSDGGYEAGSMWAGHPMRTQPPADGEVAELLEWLGKDRQLLDLRPDVKDRILRAAIAAGRACRTTPEATDD